MSGDALLEQVLVLVKTLHSNLSTDLFTPLLPSLLPPMLDLLSEYENDESERDGDRLGVKNRIKVVSVLSKIGSSLGEYTRNVVPVLVRVLENIMTTEKVTLKEGDFVKLTGTFLTSLHHLTGLNQGHAQQYSSRVIWCLVHVITSSDSGSVPHKLAMKSLCHMVCR